MEERCDVTQAVRHRLARCRTRSHQDRGELAGDPEQGERYSAGRPVEFLCILRHRFLPFDKPQDAIVLPPSGTNKSFSRIHAG